MTHPLDAAGRAHYEQQTPTLGASGGPMTWDELPGKAREVICLQIEAAVNAAIEVVLDQEAPDA